jgi:DNA topoisomerase-1
MPKAKQDTYLASGWGIVFAPKPGMRTDSGQGRGRTPQSRRRERRRSRAAAEFSRTVWRPEVRRLVRRVRTVVSPTESAEDAGLRFVTDGTPGITRQRCGSGFCYRLPNGARLRDARQIARIKSLAIPPAWTRVWICPDPRGHLQATGRDARGRKQHRYHPAWRQVRDQTKYDRMLAFGAALPELRMRTAVDLARPGLPREKVLAAVVQLLEKTLIRIGNPEYARANRSYGLTTLLDRHVRISGSTLRFSFRGKSGIRHHVEFEDPRLARIVKRAQELPGEQLFQYIADDGTTQTVDSADVNAYLRSAMGDAFTAKDFRTWTGTVLAAQAFKELDLPSSKTQAKRNILRAIEAVAKMLGNTTSVCRKCYVHPIVVDAYLDGTLKKLLRRRMVRLGGAAGGLGLAEAAVLSILRKRAGQERSAA